MRITVNSYVAKKIDDFVANAAKELREGAAVEFQKAGDKVAQEWSNAIPAGRGGSWNAQMKNISAKVTTPDSGGFFVRMGWLNGPPRAENGRTTWFIYHDTGYHMYGTQHWVSGIGVYLSMRSKLLDEMDAARSRVYRKIERMQNG